MKHRLTREYSLSRVQIRFTRAFELKCVLRAYAFRKVNVHYTGFTVINSEHNHTAVVVFCDVTLNTCITSIFLGSRVMLVLLKSCAVNAVVVTEH